MKQHGRFDLVRFPFELTVIAFHCIVSYSGAPKSRVYKITHLHTQVFFCFMIVGRDASLRFVFCPQVTDVGINLSFINAQND